MPVIDQSKLEPRTGSIYPEPYASEMAGRSSLRLGDAGGLTQFGANLVILEPGAKSSLRHWHQNQDEFVMVTEGVCTLIDDAGETRMYPGDCAAFPAGDPNGHQLVNQTDTSARFLVIGTRSDEEVGTYSDIDLMVRIKDGHASFTLKDGSPFKAPETGESK
ncbi:cupin domain-containing protein [Roseovarius sp. CAU 1744]|uniref:cupin domain-containing protein n=1 Tax=Roseovarius sp. CAU 1744 TaxID=3140368 RepID=UPI00325C3377